MSKEWRILKKKERRVYMKDILKVFRKLNINLKSFFLTHITCLIPAIIAMASNILFPSTINLIIDQGIAKENKSNILICSIIMATLGIMIIIFSYLENVSYAKFQSTLFTKMKQELFTKLINGEHTYYQKNKGGDLYTNLLTDLNNLTVLATTLIPGILINVLTLVGVGGFIVYYFGILGIIILGIASLATLGNNYFGKKIGESSSSYRQGIGKETSFLQEVLGKLEILDMMGYSDFLISKYSHLNENTKKNEVNQKRVESFSETYRLSINTILLMLVIFIGAIQTLTGKLQVGVLFSLTVYVQRLNGPLNGLIQEYLEIKRVIPYVKEINKIIVSSVNPTIYFPVVNEQLYSIETIDLGYQYGRNKQIFKNLNFKIRQGEIVGIIGKNGIGKTTLLKLFMKQCGEYSGEIIVNENINLKEIDKKCLVRQIGYLDQDNILLNGTLREIVNPNACNVSDATIWKIIKSIGLKSSVLEKGLDFGIAENARNISGGEAQKIGLIHLVLENKNWFFLDEPTSAMDEESEKKVCEYLRKYTKGKTGIIITHRKHILDICTKVIDLGRIGGMI